MGKRQIPDKLRRLAAVKERRARLDVAAKAKAVQDTQDSLEAITAKQIRSERSLRDGETSGASLQLLEMGRAVHRRQRAQVQVELQEREAELTSSKGTHKERLVEQHYKEKLYAHTLDTDRREALGREQKASDDQTSTAVARADTDSIRD